MCSLKKQNQQYILHSIAVSNTVNLTELHVDHTYNIPTAYIQTIGDYCPSMEVNDVKLEDLLINLNTWATSRRFISYDKLNGAILISFRQLLHCTFGTSAPRQHGAVTNHSVRLNTAN